MKIKLYHVDAFADKLFSGNPAAVCVLNEWPEKGVMQNIAAENNLSETAFVVRERDSFIIRWFTPITEVDLCGHATLATAHVVYNYIGLKDKSIKFISPCSGILNVTKEDELLVLDFPTDIIHEVTPPHELLLGLQSEPFETYKGKTDYMLVYRSQKDIMDLKPDFNILSKVDARGIIVTAPGETVDFVSRFFAPKVGINEDPVTGSAHTTLTPYWSNKLRKIHLSALQLSKRKGTLKCQFCGNRVKIAGKAKIYFVGEITLDADDT